MFNALAITLFAFLLSTTAHAASSELRVFVMGSWFFADQVNDYFDTQGLQRIRGAPGGGAEWSGRLGPLGIGVRGMARKMHVGDKNGARLIDGSTSYSQISMESVGPVLRLYVIDAQSFRFDVFVGGNYLHADVEAKTSNGTYNWQTNRNDYQFGTLAGGSISIGSGNAYFVMEGGYENFYLTDVRRSANAPTGVIDNIDLRGAFATIGMVIKLNSKSQGSSESSEK